MNRAIVANHREVEMRWYRDSETGDLVTGYLLSPAEVASLAEVARTADRPSLREAAEAVADEWDRSVPILSDMKGNDHA